MAKRLRRSGFSLLQLMVVVTIIVILLAVLMPAVQSGRRAARRTACLNNLKHWSLGTLNYESGLMELPMGVGRKSQSGVVQTSSLSGLVAVLPFVEMSCSGPICADFATPTIINGVLYPAYGVPLSQPNYWLWELEIDSLICPSAEPIKSSVNRTSYAFSIGDAARNISQQETLRGAYGYLKANPIDAVTDGTSNSVGLIEIGGGKTMSNRGGCWENGKATWLDDPSQVFSSFKSGCYPSNATTIGRGSHWADGRAGVGLANTILPPNSPSFQVQGSSTDDGIYSAGSMHVGGVNVAFIDGSTHFIAEDIDTGKRSTPTLTIEQMESTDGHASPHGLWGALGTIGSGEILDFNF